MEEAIAGLPGMSGIDGIRILKQAYPRLLSIVLTVYWDDQRIFNALCTGPPPPSSSSCSAGFGPKPSPGTN